MFKNKYVTLWLLLSLALIIILLLAFVDDIKIGTYTLKKAPIAETLWKDKSISDSLMNPQIFDKVKQEPEMLVEVDSLPQNFLIFGDSMTFNLSLRLAQYAKQNGHQIHALNWDSSGTKIWAESDTLEYYINLYKPTQIFIALGSNELGMTNPDSRIPYIKKILAQIGDIPYVWIGPPNWKKDSGINRVLASECAPGSFFLSDGMEFERGPDKKHPTAKSSALWMDSIIRWIPKSSHPFVATLPSDSIGKVSSNVIFLKRK